MGTAKQEITLQAGIDKENAKKVTKMIKEMKIKVNASIPVSYTHLRAHETVLDLVCRLLLEKTNTTKKNKK